MELLQLGDAKHTLAAVKILVGHFGGRRTHSKYRARQAEVEGNRRRANSNNVLN